MNLEANDIYQHPERISRGEIFPDSRFKEVVRERSQSGQREPVKRCPIRILSYQGHDAEENSTQQQRICQEEEPLKKMLPRISSVETNATACSEDALPAGPPVAFYQSSPKEVAPNKENVTKTTPEEHESLINRLKASLGYAKPAPPSFSVTPAPE